MSHLPSGARRAWMLITGEYPPQTGGVADYTRLVACELARRGEAVEVWSGPCDAASPDDPGVEVRRLPDQFGARSRKTLAASLAGRKVAPRLVVQYVPHAFGCKAMNLPWCWWLASRPEPLWVMFHEVIFPWRSRQPLLHRALALATRAMARSLTRSAEQCFVSIEGWRPLLDRFGPPRRSPVWLPVPSNLPTHVSPQTAAATRAAIGADADGIVLGHFSSYGEQIAGMLYEILPPLLRTDPRRMALLIGRNGDKFAQGLLQRHPELTARVRAPGLLPHEAAAAHLAACDLLVHPFPDGASSRRGTLMAGLALGKPIVTNDGVLCEEVWRQGDGVALLPRYSAEGFVDAVEQLLADPQRRLTVAHHASQLYERHFSVSRAAQIMLRRACEFEAPAARAA